MFVVDENDYTDVKGIEQVSELVQAMLKDEADFPPPSVAIERID